MSLVQPLVKPLVRSLVRPLVALGKSFYDLLKNLGEVWPLRSNLAGSEGTAITYTRASNDIYENVKGDYSEQSTNEPSFGVGLAVHGQITNICTNYNIEVDAALTNITDGANVTSTRVVAAQLPIGAVYAVESTATNTTGNSVQIAGGAANTNDHSAKVVAKIIAGTGAWLHIGSTPTNGVRITNTSDFEVTELNGYTPTATDTLYITPDNGTTIQWFANCYYELSFVTPHFVKTAGSSATLAQMSATVSTTGWPVNDCTYFIELPFGIIDNGANQVVFDSQLNASNYTRVFYSSVGGNISVIKRVSGVNYTASASYTADGTPLKIKLTLDSTSGMVLDLSNGNSGSDANTSGFQFNTTARLGALQATTLPLFSEVRYFGYINSVVSDIDAAYWAVKSA